MAIFVALLAIFNIFLGFIAFTPCLLAGGMGLDSPQSRESPLAISFCVMFLTFPLICVLCGIACPILYWFNWSTAALIVGFFPIVEALLVVFFIFILSMIGF